MRILMVSKACLVGSYQTKLEAIARYDDIDLAVVVPSSWNDSAGRIDLERSHTEGYELFVDRIRFNGNYHLHYYPDLGRRIRQFQPDILHMDEEPYNLATWLGVRLARREGCRSLFFSWQNIYQHYPWPFRSMEKRVLSHVDYAIMGSVAAAEVWKRKGYRGEYQIIPQFGVKAEIYHRPAADRNDQGFVIGSAGRRIVWEKGNDLILKAAARLPGEWQIRIAGDGPEKESLMVLARELGISNRVAFDGIIPSDKMPGFLSNLDVLVMASRTLPNWKEQFGRILVEAMASEVPVIGSDSGEIPNVIGDAGLIFPEDAVDVLEMHLADLRVNHEVRMAYGQAGRKRVLEHYTQEEIAARTAVVYRKMMAPDA